METHIEVRIEFQISKMDPKLVQEVLVVSILRVYSQGSIIS